jgi:hypothetical protein
MVPKKHNDESGVRSQEGPKLIVWEQKRTEFDALALCIANEGENVNKDKEPGIGGIDRQFDMA